MKDLGIRMDMDVVRRASKVKKDTSLSNAVSVTRESKRGTQFCIRKERQRSGPFLRGPSCEVREQAGQELLSIQYATSREQRRRI